MLSSTFKSWVCVSKRYVECMEAEKCCSLVQTIHHSFPIYSSKLFFNTTVLVSNCIPIMVNFAYTVVLNATEQTVLLWSCKKPVSSTP